MSKLKNILVTGGAGYIGSVLVPKLLANNYHVKVYDNFSYTDIGLQPVISHPYLTIIHADIRDEEKINEAVKNTDCIIHLAAISNDPSAELDQALTREINYNAYSIILNASKKHSVKRFINSSSIGVYGINFDNNVTEDIETNPLTEYARCKVKSEKLVKEFSSSDFTTVSMRCGTVCGWSPRMRFDLSVNTLTAIALQHKELTVWGGEQRRPQIYIEDVTDFFIELVTIDSEKINGKIFNAAGHNYKISDLAEAIKKTIDSNLIIKNMPARADERSYHVCSDKIKNELGLYPKYDITDAIKSIYDAYKQNLWTDYTSADYNNVKKITSSN